MRRVTARSLLALVLAAGLGLTACGDDDDDAAPTSGDEESADTTEASEPDSPSLGENEIAIDGFVYELQPVVAGAEITVTNRDSAPHTVTAEDETFDSGSVSGGGTGTFTAPAAGEYAVFCTIHPSIEGTLVVE